MIMKIIDRYKIPDLLGSLIADYEVFAPQRRAGLISFERVSSPEDVLLNYTNSKGSPKGLFFPRSESLFAFRKRGYADFEVEAPPAPAQGVMRRLIFGMRPCDTRSLTLLDRVFDDCDYRDPYYISRRENTTIVGLACSEPLRTCFCTSVGGGPASPEGSDILLVELEGGRYFVDVLTEKGRDLVDRYDVWEDADEVDVAGKAAAEKRAVESISSRVETDGLKEKLDGAFDAEFWDELHRKCLGCGICTYLCPTCHCFDITDEMIKEEGRRVRSWDSCMFPLFTLHASGHNPRPSGKERWRQRLMHKFNYFVENFGEIACVGCGRCVINCPVNLDIRQVVNEFASILTGL
ncbi:MAG: 4Fe-4S dicluster domain-containing protein [bacterium]